MTFCSLVLRSLFAGAVCLAFAGTATAAPLPNAQRTLKLEARDQPIDQFLQEVFSLVDVPVIVSPRLQGLVNGSFNTSADRLLNQIARAYNLAFYFDGAVMSVEPASDTMTRSFSLQPGTAERVLRVAGELQMTGQRNALRRTSTGTLVATGARRFVQQVEELVRQTASGDTQGGVAAWRQPLLDFRVFYLRYAWAHDVAVSFGGRQTVVPGVANILRSVVGLQSHAGAVSQPTPRTRPSLRGQGEGRPGWNTLGMPDASGAGTLGADGIVAALRTDARPVEVADAAPAHPLTQATGYTRIEADPRLNAVIVRDLPERLSRFAELVAALDVEPQALEIEATIIDINTDKLRELGINWRHNDSDGVSSLMFGNGTASDRLLNGRVDPTPQARGGVLSMVLGDRNLFVARISALQANGAAKIVSSPQVVTLSNVEAVFDNSSTFYVRVAGREEVDLFNVSAGTTLRVTPHVFKDNAGTTRIKLLTQVEDGSLSVRTVDTLPVVERSAINTQALINEGESLLIGGMVRDSASESEDKVPLLGDVPVLGRLFKTTQRTQARVERLFLISPRLASAKAARGAAARAVQPLEDLATPPPERFPLPPPAVPQPPSPQAPSPAEPRPIS